MRLTIAYVTSRRDCRLDWFLTSLHLHPRGELFPLIVVDRYHAERDATQGVWKFVTNSRIKHVAPKPSVWHGPSRLTKEDWFAASAYRQTALCHCATNYILYADDLSVVTPTWLDAALDAVDGGYIACGAYRKVKNLVVEHGEIKSFDDHAPGTDNRFQYGSDAGPVECGGNWLYGCSVAMPVEALLSINGWPEQLCDGMGFEDCLTGLALQNSGYPLKYDRRMLTYESEELHHAEPPLKRSDYGNSPNDKSHAALKIAQTAKWFDQSFGPFPTIRDLRQHVLGGGSFPVPTGPKVEWYTGKALGGL